MFIYLARRAFHPSSETRTNTFCYEHHARNSRSFLFTKKKKKKRDKVNIGIAECRKKKIAQQLGNRSQSQRHFTAKLKPPLTTKLLRSIRNTSPSYPHELDSEGMTSLHTTGSSTPCILPVGWSHFSIMLALILLEIEYSYERDVSQHSS